MDNFNLLLGHTAVTWALIGLIWTVQLVQYPGFYQVGEAELESFHAHHSARITWVVGPLMACELVTGIALLSARPRGVSQGLLWAGLGLIVVAWACTAMVSVPLHARLGAGELGARSALVTTNWIRTAAWSARGALVLYATRLAAQA